LPEIAALADGVERLDHVRLSRPAATVEQERGVSVKLVGLGEAPTI